MLGNSFITGHKLHIELATYESSSRVTVLSVTCIPGTANAAYCVLDGRGFLVFGRVTKLMYQEFVDTHSSCMPRGEPETAMSAFQLTWGLDG